MDPFSGDTSLIIILAPIGVIFVVMYQGWYIIAQRFHIDEDGCLGQIVEKALLVIAIVGRLHPAGYLRLEEIKLEY